MKSYRKLFFALGLLGVILIACSTSDNVDNPTENTDQELLGGWTLIYYLLDDDEIYPPIDAEDITISFNSESFEGNTGRNEFFGPYEIEDNNLTMDGFGISEVNETEWGEKFLDAILKTLVSGTNSHLIPYDINSEILVFHYDVKSAIYFRKN